MKLSICIVTYNDRDELLDSLDSLEKQKNELKVLLESDKVELVISDNASTDDTQEILSKFGTDTKIAFHNFLQTRNLGFRGNLEFCATAANGEWILFLGAGDQPSLEAIKGVVSIDWPSACNLIYFNSQSVDVKTGIIQRNTYAQSEKPAFSQAPFPMFRRSELLRLLAGHPNLSGDFWPQVEWALGMSQEGPNQIEVLSSTLILSKRPHSGWWSQPDAFLAPIYMNPVLKHFINKKPWNQSILKRALVNNPSVPAIWIYQSRVPHNSRRPKVIDVLRIYSLFSTRPAGLLAVILASLIWLMPRSMLSLAGKVARRFMKQIYPEKT